MVETSHCDVVLSAPPLETVLTYPVDVKSSDYLRALQSYFLGVPVLPSLTSIYTLF